MSLVEKLRDLAHEALMGSKSPHVGEAESLALRYRAAALQEAAHLAEGA